MYVHCDLMSLLTVFQSFHKGVWTWMLIFVVLPQWNIIPQTHDMVFHPITLCSFFCRKEQPRTILTSFSLETLKRVIGKQCRPRSANIECSIWSGSPQFELVKGVVGCGKGVVCLTSPGRPTYIGLQLGRACYPCSR